MPGHLHHPLGLSCPEDHSHPGLRELLRASDFPGQSFPDSRPGLPPGQGPCTTSSPQAGEQVPESHWVLEREGLWVPHTPAGLLAPLPHLLDPSVEQGVLLPVPVVDAQHQGRQEEQEDDEEGDQDGFAAWQGKHRDE